MIMIGFPEFIGATLCAAKNDIRYYLNGIFISKDGDVVGTNGHMMFAGKCVSEHDTDVIVQIKGKHPAKFTRVIIDVNAKVANFKDKDQETLCAIPLEIIDGRYPDWKRVMNYKEGKVSEIGLNLDYMAVIAKIGKNYLRSGKNAQKVKFQDSIGGVHFDFNPTTSLILMLARVE